MTKPAGRMAGRLALILGLAVLCPAQTKRLTILHANDTHSALLPFRRPSVPPPFSELIGKGGPGRKARAPIVGETGGIARMATLIKRTRLREKNVLALHAGDVFVGSFEFSKYLGYPELKIMEDLYDAMSLGNHELDLGMDALAGVVSGALSGGEPVDLPLLCANIDFAMAPAHPLSGLIKTSIVKEVDGIRIGIFGVVNEDRENYSPEVIGRLSGDVDKVAGLQAGLLRQKGCQIVIALSHLGTEGDLASLADKVPGIDIIVGGHSHDLFDDAVVRHGKIIVQAGSHGQYLGQLTVDFEPGKGVRLHDWAVTPVDSRIEPDPDLQGRLNPLREGVIEDPRFGPVYSRTVARAGRDIAPDWPANGPSRDAPLGNLVTDAMRSALMNAGFRVDCVLDALGYTEFGIPAGKVVGNDIMRAVPYGYDPDSGLGFKLLIVPMAGQLILGGLDYAVSTGSKSMSIQVSGLTYSYHSKAGHIIPESVMINGEAVAKNPNKKYNVVMTEGIYGFLAPFAASFAISLAPIPTGIFEYDAVCSYMRSLHVVNAVSEGRVLDLAAAPTVEKKR